MTKVIQYYELTPAQQKLFDAVAAVFKDEDPSDWFPVHEALRRQLEVDALSQVPYRGPDPLVIAPRVSTADA